MALEAARAAPGARSVAARPQGPAPNPPNPFWNAVLQVARKEVLQHIRTKRLLIIGGLLALSLALITLVFGPAILRGIPSAGVAKENVVFLAYFSVFFIGGYFFLQLLPIVLTADAVCSEWANRTVFLLLSKPVSRSAFVLGKLLGSYVTVAATVVVLFGLDYALMQGFYSGSPSGGEVLGFVEALGVLILGAGAFAAIALFFSTLTRSTVLSLLMTLGVWIMVLPLLGQVGLFAALGDRSFNGDLSASRIDNWRYLSPGSDMAVAGKFLVPDAQVRDALSFLSQAPNSNALAILSLVLYTGAFLGLSLLVVQRRNFE